MDQDALAEAGGLVERPVNALLAYGFALVVVGFPFMLVSHEPRLVFAPYFGVTIFGLLFLRAVSDRE